jgi:hypothetical protein
MVYSATSPVICFLDESATDATDTDFAVVAGMVMNRKDIPEFDSAWSAMLDRHEALDGLHMRDLGPKGPYPHLVGEKCAACLAEAVSIINRTRIFTFAASHNNRIHEASFSTKLREEVFSVYSLAFMMTVEINRASAAHQGYTSTIDFVFDEGNRYRRQVQALYDSIRANPEAEEYKVGTLEFCSDKQVPALQGADLISWAMRRRKAGKEMKNHHAPLNDLFDKFFADSPMREDVLQQMSESFARMEAGLAE